MPRDISCPRCRQRFAIPDGETQTRFPCPRCLTDVAAPSPLAAGEPPIDPVESRLDDEVICSACDARFSPVCLHCPECNTAWTSHETQRTAPEYGSDFSRLRRMCGFAVGLLLLGPLVQRIADPGMTLVVLILSAGWLVPELAGCFKSDRSYKMPGSDPVGIDWIVGMALGFLVSFCVCLGSFLEPLAPLWLRR